MNRTQSIALVRALAAVSWADGQLTRSEESYLKSLAYRVGLDPETLGDELQPLLDFPVSHDSGMEIVGDFLRVLGSDADRRAFLDELDRLVAIDGEVSDDERSMVEEIRRALDEYGALDLVLGRIRGALGTLLVGRRRAPRAPEAFAKNTALQHLIGDLDEQGLGGAATADVLNRAVLEASIMARVARAGGGIDPPAVERIATRLEACAGVDGAVRDAIIDLVERGSDRSMDRQRLCAEYNRISTLDERRDLVTALYALAGAAPTDAASSEIRLIANFFWIPARDVVALRQRAPVQRGG